jgi:hypothetical protein
MKSYYPYTIGSSKPVDCNNGIVNDIRCPYWQQDGQYVYVENLMNSPIIMESSLCQYIPEIVRDFEVAGNYRWHCTQWPGIREKLTTCILQDIVGNKFTVNEVIARYSKEVKVNDGEGEITRSELYH